MPINSPPNESALELMRSNSLGEAHKHGTSVTTLETAAQITKKTDDSAIEKFQSPPPDRPYCTTILWDDGPYNVALFLCKATYRVGMKVDNSSSAMLTVASLVGSRASSESG